MIALAIPKLLWLRLRRAAIVDNAGSAAILTAVAFGKPLV
jgi:hypothetical protein